MTSIGTPTLAPDARQDYARLVDDDAIRSLVTRLARARPGGGTTIERAAILAEGADFDAVMTWIVGHGGQAEAATKSSSGHGLHGGRLRADGSARSRAPARFILPAGALD
jgi:hypothetical protein